MRQPRKTSPGATYHVVARINRQEFIFQNSIVKDMFLEMIMRAKKKFRFSVTNICMMDNHFHMMITPGPGESLSRIMQWILGVFALKYNRIFSLKGHVWYDRFKSKIIASLRQFIATFEYIRENPVKAGIVDRQEEYRYSGPMLIRYGPPGLVDPPSLVLQHIFPFFGKKLLGIQLSGKIELNEET